MHHKLSYTRHCLNNFYCYRCILDYHVPKEIITFFNKIFIVLTCTQILDSVRAHLCSYFIFSYSATFFIF